MVSFPAAVYKGQWALSAGTARCRQKFQKIVKADRVKSERVPVWTASECHECFKGPDDRMFGTRNEAEHGYAFWKCDRRYGKGDQKNIWCKRKRQSQGMSAGLVWQTAKPFQTLCIEQKDQEFYGICGRTEYQRRAGDCCRIIQTSGRYLYWGLEWQITGKIPAWHYKDTPKDRGGKGRCRFRKRTKRDFPKDGGWSGDPQILWCGRKRQHQWIFEKYDRRGTG